MHRDIKPENLLLDKNCTLKVCDFGWCILLKNNDDQRETFCGTYEYIAPELYNNKKYDKSVDIWSLGVLLYEMLHGHSPYKGNFLSSNFIHFL